jgi:ubiquinone/menaquinone biosynthesis C-methylase UbiE
MFDVRILIWLGGATLAYGVASTAGWYLARFVLPGSPSELADNVVSTLAQPTAENVLDVGTGRGLFAIAAAKRMPHAKVIGIDVWVPQSQESSRHHGLSRPTGHSIDNARRNAKIEGVSDRVTFADMDATRLDFESGSFDLVICAYLLSHLGAHSREVLAEVRRVLRPGGRLVVVDNVRDLYYLLLSTPHFFAWSYMRGGKARQLTEDHWRALIKDAGFVLQEQRSDKAIIFLKATCG